MVENQQNQGNIKNATTAMGSLNRADHKSPPVLSPKGKSIPETRDSKLSSPECKNDDDENLPLEENTPDLASPEDDWEVAGTAKKGKKSKSPDNQIPKKPFKSLAASTAAQTASHSSRASTLRSHGQGSAVNSSSTVPRSEQISGANIGRTSSLFHPTSPRYQRVTALKKMSAEHRGQVGTLGNSLGMGLDYSDIESYGLNTAELKDAASMIFKNFIHNQKRRRTLVKHQQVRHSRLQHSKNTAPCFGIAIVVLNGKHKCCIMAVSRPQLESEAKKDKDDNDHLLMSDLKACAQDCTKDDPNQMPYFLVSHCSKDYNNTLVDNHRHLNNLPEKSCAEKFLSSVLDKLFKEFGEKIQVAGFMTYNFYPYKGDKAAANNGLYQGIVDAPIYTDNDIQLPADENNSAYRIPVRPACKDCQLNKSMHFYSWRLSQSLLNPAGVGLVPTSSLQLSISAPSEDGGEKQVADYLRTQAAKSVSEAVVVTTRSSSPAFFSSTPVSPPLATVVESETQSNHKVNSKKKVQGVTMSLQAFRGPQAFKKAW